MTNASGAISQSTTAGPPIFGDNQPRRTIEKTAQPLYKPPEAGKMRHQAWAISRRAHSVPLDRMCRLELLENSEPET